MTVVRDFCVYPRNDSWPTARVPRAGLLLLLVAFDGAAGESSDIIEEV